MQNEVAIQQHEYSLRQAIRIATEYHGQDEVENIGKGYPSLFQDYILRVRTIWEDFRMALKDEVGKVPNYQVIGLDLNEKFLPMITKYLEWYEANKDEKRKFGVYNPYSIINEVCKDTKKELEKYFSGKVNSTEKFDREIEEARKGDIHYYHKKFKRLLQRVSSEVQELSFQLSKKEILNYNRNAVSFVETDEFVIIEAAYKSEIETRRTTIGVDFVKYAEPIYYELGFQLVLISSALAHYSSLYDNDQNYLMFTDPLEINPYCRQWQQSIRNIQINSILKFVKREGVRFKNPFELTINDYNLTGDFQYYKVNPASDLNNPEKDAGELEKEIYISPENIESIYNALAPYFRGQETKLKQLLEGKAIEGNLIIKKSTIEYAHSFCFLAMDNKISSPKEDVLTWFCQYFLDKNSKPLNPKTIKKYFEHDEIKVSDKMLPEVKMLIFNNLK